MDASLQLVVFTLHEQAYALRLAAVERIFRVAEITALPGAPPIVLGIVNVQGRVIAVVDIRRRFRLPVRQISLSDRLIIATARNRPIALIVESVIGVVERSQSEIVAAENIVPQARDIEQYIAGVLKLEDGLILIHDLDTFLSEAEQQKLEQALAPS